MSSLPISSSRAYQGNSDISFSLDDQHALSVAIDTDRLSMRSVHSEDLDSYAALFGDQDVMEKFGDGKPKSKQDIEMRINDVWLKRWERNDPFSPLAVYKNDTDEFLGHVVLGHGDEAGQSELAYLFMKSHWGKGYGTEAVGAVVLEYAPAITQQGYRLEGEFLKKITVTARTDNPASFKILENLGMTRIKTEEKFGAQRHHYSISIK